MVKRDESIRLSRLIVKILDTIKNQIEAIAENSKSKNASEQIEREASVRLPPDLDPTPKQTKQPESHEQGASNWRWWATTSLEVLGIIGLGIYAWLTYQQWRTANTQTAFIGSQVGIMQKQLEATDRAWVSIDIAPTFPITTLGGEQQFRFSITLKNVGRSVANGVTVKYRVAIPKWGPAVFKEPVTQQRALCGTPPNSSVKDSESENLSIFPDKTAPGALSTGVTAQQIKDGAVPSPDRRVFFAPVLVGCVDYVFPTALKHHQTGFIYNIERFDPAIDPNHPLTIVAGQNLPANKIVLERYFFGGDYAY